MNRGYHDLPAAIRKVEHQVGSLSLLEKILLTTDGSVTSLLEVATGSDVRVCTISQEILSPDSACQQELEIGADELINHRIVTLKNAHTGEPLIYAVSDTPLGRLLPSFRQDMMRADIPIGKILRSHQIEARREITAIEVIVADDQISAVFAIPLHTPCLQRRYRIIHDEKPFMAIREVLPGRASVSTGRVTVVAPSRIHISLIDLCGTLGRVDAGIGITLERPCGVLEACLSGAIEVTGGDGESRKRVRDAARRYFSHTGENCGASLHLHDTIPGHTGLGSGTQLALSTLAALSALHHRSMPVREMASVAGRGGTSGIGAAAFEFGGFLMDGGHSFGEGKDKSDFRPSSAASGVIPASITNRQPFPDDWDIVLAIPCSGDRVHGEKERDIFREFCPVPLDEVREVCHEIVMRLLPGLVEHNLLLFGEAVNRIQELGFKRHEISLQSPLITSLIHALRDAGAPCVGMSSFGPAVYAITKGNTREIADVARGMCSEPGGQVLITKGRNRGADIRCS